MVEAFQAAHGIEELVIVADAGMLSAANLTALDKAHLRFIVGARTTRAPGDLEAHFGLLGVFRTVLVLCFRLPSSGPGNRFRPRRECDTLELSEDEYDCISARSMRQYP